MTEERKPAQPDWSEVVSKASEHVQERRVAADEAAERQKPRARGPVLAAAAVVFAGVLAWDLYMFAQPPEPPPLEEVTVDLRWFVADAVELIEGFRAENGRLPARADLGDLLPADIVYEIRGDTYVVAASEEGLRVEFDGSLPLQRWVQGDAAVGGS
jgi:hypothetical protein